MNSRFNGLGKFAIVMLIAGAILMILSFIADSQRAYYNYLLMYVNIVSLGVGSLAIVAMDYMFDAIWSTPFRRVAEFFSSVIPLLLVLAIPLIFGIHSLFEWSHNDVVSQDPILQGKSPYLNPTFFNIRLFLCVLLWMLFYYLITGTSQKQDKTKEFNLLKKNIRNSVIFAPVLFITLSIAAIDLIMSLMPHWYSTIFGIYYFAGSAVAALALWSFSSVKLQEGNHLHPNVMPRHYHSMGTLFFAMIIFWAYIGFSQYLLIWYADIPEETIWLQVRMHNGWQYISIGLIFVHFLIPFLILLPGAAKTNFKILKIMGIWLLIAHYIDLYWLVMPNLFRQFTFSWNEFGFILFTIGLMAMAFKYKADRVNLTPIEDPKIGHGLAIKLYPDISID